MNKKSLPGRTTDFVATMLESAQNKSEVKPPTISTVDGAQLEQVMLNLKKGVFRQ